MIAIANRSGQRDQQYVDILLTSRRQEQHKVDRGAIQILNFNFDTQAKASPYRKEVHTVYKDAIQVGDTIDIRYSTILQTESYQATPYSATKTKTHLFI